MQTLMTDSSRNRSLLGRGWSMVGDNKRYIFWFYVLNLTLAEFGASAFRNQAHAILDHSLLSQRLVTGFDVAVFSEMLARPEFGPTTASNMSAMYFALLFFVATALFMPGILQGYASTYRLPREDFFRACGRNLWRFIRLMIIAGIVMSIVAGILFGIRGALIKAAGESTNELLPFYTSMACLLIIFLVMCALRIWFDLAEADVVLSDQRAVRRSIGKAFRHILRHRVRLRLLGSYVVATIVAAIFLVGGLWVWMKFVPPASVLRAFFVSQLMLLLLLIPRFWQRGVAVSYYKQHMIEPIVEQSFTAPASTAPATELPVAVAVSATPAETPMPIEGGQLKTGS
jgi:hypothetical protein